MSKKNNQNEKRYKQIFWGVNWIIAFNIYLIYQSIFSTNGLKQLKSSEAEFAQYKKTFKENNEDIDRNIEILNILSHDEKSMTKIKNSDYVTEFIKKNYDYKKDSEKIRQTRLIQCTNVL
jgi:cell division protein FtsB